MMHGPPPPVDFTLYLQHACIKQSSAYAGSKVVMKVLAKASGLVPVLKPAEPFNEASTNISTSFADIEGMQSANQLVTKKPKSPSPERTSQQHPGGSGEGMGMGMSVMDIGFLTVTLTLDTQHRFQHVDIESDFFMG
ncbi:hypothetical protein EON63_21970 [archaeon]|nr:MAG: hypothetical protein EON63_21970 [archaeon]